MVIRQDYHQISRSERRIIVIRKDVINIRVSEFIVTCVGPAQGVSQALFDDVIHHFPNPFEFPS